MSKRSDRFRKFRGIWAAVRAGLASDRFFYAIAALLVVQAGWIALTGRFPMAYDEQNHIGVVKMYASHISPFWAEQPPGDAPYSAVSRDPSYLYHWLMSFPYRLFDLFWKTDASKVLAFRFISIGLFAAGLILYRKLLLRTRAGKALVHTALALFVLVPTVPFLAGQMNYDNLLFPLVAGLLLLTTRIVDDTKAGRLDSRKVALFAGMGMLTGLVKFPFLPLLLAMAVWLLIVWFRQHGRAGWRQFGRLFKESFASLKRPMQVALVLFVLVSGGLFFERYGINAIRYGTPIPECDQVLDIQRCQAFGPWKRNYDIYQAKLNGTLEPMPPSTGVVYFTVDEWLKLLVWQFFYTLNGPIDNFSVGFPYAIPYYSGIWLAGIGAILVIIFRKRVLRRPFMTGLACVALSYVFVLWAQNYSDFLRLYLATAIQARYIVLVLPIFFLVLALAYAAALRKLPQLKTVLAVGAITVLLTQGGGIAVFILRSNELWWWQNATVIQVNRLAKQLLEPVVIDTEVNAPKENY